MKGSMTETAEVDGENGTHLKIRYTIQEELSDAGNFGCVHYGMKIEKEGGEELVVPDITISEERITQLLRLISRNSVTPLSFPDVLEDWL